MKDITQAKDYSLIIIDGKNAAYRYFSTMGMLKNKQGVSTGMFHGFLSMTLKLAIEHPQSKIVVVWEGGKLERVELLKSYKQGRHGAPTGFEIQCKHLQQLLHSLGVSQVYSPGYEADDCAATLSAKEDQVLFVSEDHDWYQLLRPGSAIRQKGHDLSYTQVLRQEGFPPDRYASYTVLCGKASNNVSGLSRFPKDLGRVLTANHKDIPELLLSLSLGKCGVVEGKWKQLLLKESKRVRELYNIVKMRRDVQLQTLPCKKINIRRMLQSLGLNVVMRLFIQAKGARGLKGV